MVFSSNLIQWLVKNTILLCMAHTWPTYWPGWPKSGKFGKPGNVREFCCESEKILKLTNNFFQKCNNEKFKSILVQKIRETKIFLRKIANFQIVITYEGLKIKVFREKLVLLVFWQVYINTKGLSTSNSFVTEKDWR